MLLRHFVVAAVLGGSICSKLQAAEDGGHYKN
jgi:hypothetical protein